VQTVVAEAQRRSGAQPGSLDGLTYLSDAVTAAAMSPDLAAKIVNEASDYLSQQLKRPLTGPDRDRYLESFAHIASAVRGNQEILSKLANGLAGRGEIISSGTIRTLVGRGTDPTLFFELAQNLRGTVARGASTRILREVVMGAEDFLKNYQHKINETVAGNEIFQLAANYGFITGPEQFQSFLRDYYNAHPDKLKELEENGKQLDALGANGASLLLALDRYGNGLRIAQGVRDQLQKFTGNPVIMEAIGNSPSAMAIFANYASEHPDSWAATRDRLIATGSVITRTFVARLDVAVLKWVTTGAGLAAIAGNGDLAVQRLGWAARQPWLGISPLARDNFGHASALLQDLAAKARTAPGSDEYRQALNRWIADPKLRLSLYADNAVGRIGRGAGVLLTVNDIFAVANDSSVNPWQRGITASYLGLSALQQATLVARMAMAPDDWSRAGQGLSWLRERYFNLSVSAVDRIGDRMIFLGAAVDTVNGIFAYQRGDMTAAGLNALSAAGGLSAAFGPLATSYDLPVLGRWLTPIGGGTIMLAQVVLVLHDLNKRADALARLTVNEDAARLLESAGVNRDMARVLAVQSGGGLRTGPLLAVLARQSGLDMSTPDGRAALIDYLNHGLRPEQAAVMRRAAFAAMDRNVAAKDFNGEILPVEGPQDADAGRPVLHADPRADRTRFPFGPWADAGALQIADYSIGDDGAIYRTGADGVRTRADPDTDPYARMLAARRPNDSRSLRLYPDDHAFPRSQNGLIAWMAGAGLPLPGAAGAPSAPQLYAAQPAGAPLALRADPSIGMLAYAFVSRDQPLLATGQQVPGWIQVTGRNTHGIFATGWIPADEAVPFTATAAPPRPAGPVTEVPPPGGLAPARMPPAVTAREPGPVAVEPPAAPSPLKVPDELVPSPPAATGGPGKPAPADVPIPRPRPHHEERGRKRPARRWLPKLPRRRGPAQEAPPDRWLWPFPFGPESPASGSSRSRRGRQGRGTPEETAPLDFFRLFDEAPRAREPARGRHRKRSDLGEGEGPEA
jgi:hypothetical protein